MAVDLDTYTPSVTSARRWYWLSQQRRAAEGDPGAAAVWRARRLEQPGTRLFRRLPGRGALLAAGVLAVEEVVGAGVDELRSYGLSRSTAEALITLLEGIAPMTTFSYGPRTGQAYDEDAVELIAAGTRTASFTSDIYEVGDRTTLRLLLALTAISGTGAVIHVQVETREAYASGTWRVVDAFGPLTAAASLNRTMAGLDRFVRVVITIGGSSPSTTFALTGAAV